MSCAACTYSSLNVVLVLFCIQNELCGKDQSKRAPFLFALKISHSNHQQGFACRDIRTVTSIFAIQLVPFLNGDDLMQLDRNPNITNEVIFG